MNVAARAGRPRDRDLAGLPEPVRGRPGGRRRRHPPRAPRGGRLGARRRPAARARSRPATRLIVVNAPHNPTGMLPDRGDVRRRSSRSPPRPGVHLLVDEVYRCLEFDEADRLPAGADALERGISLGRDVEVVRDGRPADRLAGDPRPRRSSPACAAFKDYTTICSSAPSEILAIIGAARARPGPRPVARRSSRANLELLDAFFEDWAGPVQLGPSAGRLDRLPAADRPGRPDRRLGGELVEAEGVLLLPGLAVRLSGQPLPDRLRPDGPARGARPARGIRARRHSDDHGVSAPLTS